MMVMIMATQGLPDSEKGANMVMNVTDTLAAETRVS